jgi:GT2 family glycosyltransferase
MIEAVIVNFNAGEALLPCVQSLLGQGGELRVIVADNASSDGSMEGLRERLADDARLQLSFNRSNLGFARAVNGAVGELGHNPGPAGYLLILNPDCEMHPGSLAALQQALAMEPRAALAGPRVVDRDGRTMRGTLRRFPDPWKSLMTFSGLWRLARWWPGFGGVELSDRLPEKTSECEAVSGACMLLRKSTFLELGGMDEAYGLHGEDLDLMFRLDQAGHRCLIVPEARVYHRQGVSSRSRPLWVHWQRHRGMQRFFRKFQAADCVLPLRWLVIGGIWLRFALTAPLALIRS